MHCEWQFAVAIILYINVETKWQESLAAHMVQRMNPVPGVTCLSSGLPSNVVLRQINLMNPRVPPCFAHRDRHRFQGRFGIAHPRLYNGKRHNIMQSSRVR